MGVDYFRRALVASFLIAGLGLVSTTALAQPNTQITATDDATALVGALLGGAGDLTIRSVEYIGHPLAAGTFVDGPHGMSRGIALSTGLVEEMAYQGTARALSHAFGTDGYRLCRELTDTATNYDAALLKIRFDLPESADGIIIDHIIGTDEYPDFIGTRFNDGFGIFLNGENIAVSVDDIPVTVNEYFTPGAPTEVLEWPETETSFNGGTPRFSTRASLARGSLANELIILVCDGADQTRDTGAFLSSLSACYGDCTRTSQCGDGILNPGEVCDGAQIAAGYGQCPAGYSGAPLCNNHPANPEGDGSCTFAAVPYGCVDIDECANPALNNCHAYGTCENTPGSFRCECGPGYNGDGVVCRADVTVSLPADGSRLENKRPRISGSGEPGATVTVSANGVVLGTTLVGADGKWSFEPTSDLPGGNVRIEATDSHSEDETMVIIDGDGPALVVNNPEEGAVIVPAHGEVVTGKAEPGAEIMVTVDGVLVGITTADEDGDWSVLLPGDLDGGPAQIVVIATYDDGSSNRVARDVFIEGGGERYFAGGGISTCSTMPGSDASLLLFFIALGLVGLSRGRRRI